MFSRFNLSCCLLVITTLAVLVMLIWPTAALSSLPQEKCVTVSLGLSQRGNIQRTLSFTGSAAYAGEYYAVSPQSGFVAWVTPKREGQPIAAGEALMRLDTSNHETLLAACFLEPTEPSLSEELLDAVRGQTAFSAETLETAVSQSTVRAYQAGQVLQPLVRRGEPVQAGTPVALLASEQQEVRGLVSAKERRQLTPGMPVRLEREGSFIAWGRIDNIGSLTAESAAGVPMAQVTVTPLSPTSLALGETVDVIAVLQEASDVVTVPLEAIDQNGRVWQVHEGRAWPLAASIDLFDEKQAWVAGLSENVSVILSPPQGLQAGQRVREAQ